MWISSSKAATTSFGEGRRGNMPFQMMNFTTTCDYGEFCVCRQYWKFLYTGSQYNTTKSVIASLLISGSTGDFQVDKLFFVWIPPLKGVLI
jgi:hypothetical protein